MVSINRQCWEHLAPKVMHRRVRELEALLQSWTRSDYGAHWLESARREDGLVRVSAGQFIPVAHVIALPGRRMFVAPQERLRAEHRMVRNSAMASGRPLADSELALRPQIRVDVGADA